VILDLTIGTAGPYPDHSTIPPEEVERPSTRQELCSRIGGRTQQDGIQFAACERQACPRSGRAGLGVAALEPGPVRSPDAPPRNLGGAGLSQCVHDPDLG
jgi:hypothetical protein